MKFTLSWLRDHVATEASLERRTDALTMLGHPGKCQGSHPGRLRVTARGKHHRHAGPHHHAGECGVGQVLEILVENIA